MSLLLVTLVAAHFLAPAAALAGKLPRSIAETKIVETRIVMTTPERVRSLIDEAANSWMQGNAKAFASLFTPDGEFVVPGQRWIGSAAIEHAAAEFATSNSQVNIKIQRVLIEGQQAVVEWQWEDTENATGKRTQADDAIVVDFVNGKIQRWREYIDSTTPQKAG